MSSPEKVCNKGLTLNKCRQNVHSQYKAIGLLPDRIQQRPGVYKMEQEQRGPGLRREGQAGREGGKRGR